jgi:hypothetical protein
MASAITRSTSVSPAMPPAVIAASQERLWRETTSRNQVTLASTRAGRSPSGSSVSAPSGTVSITRMTSR